MGEKIIVRIDAEGRVAVRVEGVAGPACRALTKDLEKHLGSSGTPRKTADWHKTPVKLSSEERTRKRAKGGSG